MFFASHKKKIYEKVDTGKLRHWYILRLMRVLTRYFDLRWYFFNVIREATYSDDEDEEWEEEQEFDEAKLKVEVRKMNGGWLR